LTAINLFLLIDAVEQEPGRVFDAGGQPLMSIRARGEGLEEPGVTAEPVGPQVSEGSERVGRHWRPPRPGNGDRSCRPEL